jgi:hypothetical protein
MATNTFQRYSWLIETLSRLRYAEFKEIQAEWKSSGLNLYNDDLPKRTFRNHITAIADQFNLYIEYKKGRGFYIANPEDLESSRIKQWMISTLSTYNFLADCQDLKDRILFEEVPSCHRDLPPIIQAMRNQCALTFMYQSHFSMEAHPVEVEPYCLKLFKRRRYLVGREIETEKLKTYALERMTEMDETAHAYSIPTSFNADEYFINYFGIITHGKPELIKLKAIPLEAKYLRALPLHHSQEETETYDEYSIFTLYLSPTWDFKQELLSRANQIEVLAPASLREWMKDTISKMHHIYQL